MDYDRWAITERMKWFGLENAGKIALLFLVYVIAAQFPEQSLALLNEGKIIFFDVLSFIEEKKEFIFGVSIAVFLNYLKDAVKSSKETKAIGHALREEARALKWKTDSHLEGFKRYYKSHDDIDSGLRLEKDSMVPEKLFHGTDYMPFFKANTGKVASLKVRFLLGGDEVVSMTSRMYKFINEYEHFHSSYVKDWEQAVKDYAEAESKHTRKKIVHDFYFARQKYEQRIRGFRDNCGTLVVVLARYRH